MSFQPKKEELRKAVKWISDMRKFEPGKSNQKLAEEAAMKFNLSPTDTDFLYRFLRGEIDMPKA